jgi:hypothetical protein
MILSLTLIPLESSLGENPSLTDPSSQANELMNLGSNSAFEYAIMDDSTSIVMGNSVHSDTLRDGIFFKLK